MNEFIKPLTSQLNYFKFVLKQRQADTDNGFEGTINPNELSAYEIGHHAIQALWENALRFDPDQPMITELEKKSENYGSHLIRLYNQAIERFQETIHKLDDITLQSSIKSPVSGRDTILCDWLWTTVMHTIHHMGQSIGLQGMIQRRQQIVI